MCCIGHFQNGGNNNMLLLPLLHRHTFCVYLQFREKKRRKKKFSRLMNPTTLQWIWVSGLFRKKNVFLARAGQEYVHRRASVSSVTTTTTTTAAIQFNFLCSVRWGRRRRRSTGRGKRTLFVFLNYNNSVAAVVAVVPFGGGVLRVCISLLLLLPLPCVYATESRARE